MWETHKDFIPVIEQVWTAYGPGSSTVDVHKKLTKVAEVLSG